MASKSGTFIAALVNSVDLPTCKAAISFQSFTFTVEHTCTATSPPKWDIYSTCLNLILSEFKHLH